MWLEECLTQDKRPASLLSHKTWKVGSLAVWNVNPIYFRHIWCDVDKFLLTVVTKWLSGRWTYQRHPCQLSSLQCSFITKFVCFQFILLFSKEYATQSFFRKGIRDVLVWNVNKNGIEAALNLWSTLPLSRMIFRWAFLGSASVAKL